MSIECGYPSSRAPEERNVYSRLMRHVANQSENRIESITARSGLPNPLHKIPSTLRNSLGSISPEHCAIVRVFMAWICLSKPSRPNNSQLVLT